MTKSELWWRGHEWLADRTKWPPDIATQATQSQAERKVQRELFKGSVEVSRDFDHLCLEKFGLHKALRVCAWSHESSTILVTLPRRS